LIVPILISVALLTLIERKILGHTQNREGPILVGYQGLIQPLADGAKLFTKELFFTSSGNYILFMLAPTVAFTISIVI
jgi:NADH:ubiquinone oxidoreductase subunit H